MRIEQLKYISEVASSGSISAAAKQLYINQTTLSAAIQAAESELGEKIFQRTPKGIVLTSYGERAMPQIRQLLQQYDELLWLNQDSARVPQKVHICIYACACHFWGLYLTDALQKKRIHSQVVIHASAGNKVMPAIQEGKGSIGIGAAFPHRLEVLKNQAEQMKMVVEPLYTDSTSILLSENSPLAKKRAIAPSDLEEEHLALTDCCLERFYISPFAAHIGQVSIFGSVETARVAVRENNMICIMPRTCAQAQPVSGTVTVPLEDDKALRTMMTYMIHPHNSEMNTVEQTLVGAIREWCRVNLPEDHLL